MRTLSAVNTAPDSENRMHGDEARRFGFRGGLVPGVDVLGYLAHEAVAEWGADWLASGRMEGRLDAPVYDGEVVRVRTTRDGSTLQSEVTGDGKTDGVRARAALSLLDDDSHASRADVLAAADPARFATAPLPEPDRRLPASRELLAPGTVLGTQRAAFRADLAPRYLDEISEDHPAFRVDGLAHPGWLLRFANWSLARTVQLGPWIHVSTDASFLAPVRDGDQLEVRGVIADRYERKAHELVDLDVLALRDDRPVLLARHTAIWRPRPRR
ncbi:MAG: hypothetical protein HYX32_11055 [Actinobacteria bacterium]|nr:hypothetical protein [Actinomycetota bacterium]